MAQMNPSMKQKQTQGHRKQACDCQGEGGSGREGLELGISRCKLLYIEWIGKKVLLYSTGSYIQYPVIHVSLNVTTYGILSESLATLLSSIK